MRRSIIVAAVAAVIAGFVVSAVTLAGDNSTRKLATHPASSPATPARTFAKLANGSKAGGFMPAMADMVLGDLAQKLGVSKDDLVAALPKIAGRQIDRALARGTISADQAAAAKACIASQGKGCDRRQLRAALRSVVADVRKNGLQLGRLKTELSQDASAELGKPADQIVAAVRDELKTKLDQGVAIGFIPDRVRTLALQCFDAPDSCKVGRFHREARRMFGFALHH